MEDKPRFVTGIDIGTKTVRVVLGEINKEGFIRVLAHTETPSEGMRKGVVTDLDAVTDCVMKCLADAERRSGVTVKSATTGINGVSLTSVKADGSKILQERDISDEDINGVLQLAADSKDLQNSQILSIEPYEFILDEQRGIREPIGMHGRRLDVRANIISILRPDYENLLKTQAEVGDVQMYPGVLAAADAVLKKQQRENGVCVVDLGATTTGIAIYDGGVLQYVAVVPYGSNDITNDLAKVLGIYPEMAEEIKLKHASGIFDKESNESIVCRNGRDAVSFRRGEVDEIIEARLDEIFEGVCNHMKKAGYDGRLPEGIILTGGGANMKNLNHYIRARMGTAARVGVVGIGLEEITSKDEREVLLKPEYATAIGLMIKDRTELSGQNNTSDKKKAKKTGPGFFAKLFSSMK